MKIICFILGHKMEYYIPEGQENIPARLSCPRCIRCKYDPLGSVVKQHTMTLKNQLKSWSK